MALNFPSSPSLNETHTVGSKTWKWNGSAWDIQTTPAADSASLVAAWATANGAYSQANTATTLAQAAYDAANNSSSAAQESLNLAFNNSNATQYKIVTMNANAETILATALDINQIDKIIGVLDNQGETISLGLLENLAWAWSPDQALFLGSNGDIVTTSTVDGAAFSLKIGHAVTSTKIFIKIGTPIIL